MEKSSLVWKNTGLLYFIRGLQMLFPLITLPYLTHVLNKDNFGLVVFCQAYASFASVFIEYGFNYTATRDIAESRDSISTERKIFTEVTWSKFVLSILLSLFTIVYLGYFSKFTFTMVLCTLLLSISQGYMPIWYFQGKSSMFNISIMELISRIFNFLGLLIFIKQQNQGQEYIIILTFLSCIFSLLQNAIIFRKISLSACCWLDIRRTLHNGMSFFVFRIGSILYSSGSIFLLSNIVDKPQLAVYGGADRIFRAAASLTGPIGDAFYPRIIATHEVDPKQSKQLVYLASSVLIIGSFSIAVLLFFLAHWIINLLLGSQYHDSEAILRILAWDIPLIALGTILGVFGLLPRRLDKSFSMAVLLGGIVSLFSILLGVPKLGLRWMAISIIFAEVIVVIYCVGTLLRYRRKESG